MQKRVTSEHVVRFGRQHSACAHHHGEKHLLKGSCLCGGIQFEVTGFHSKIGICHCSLCRKVSGVGSTAVIVMDFNNLSWRSGKGLVRQFARPSGYGVSFCRVCGSPAPDWDREETIVILPVGLLDDNPTLHVSDHIYAGSKATWDVIGDDGAPQYDEDDGPPRKRDQRA